MTKKCSRCQKVKLLDDFSNNRSRPDGKCTYCRSCNAESVSERRRADPEKFREAGREWRMINPEKEREAQRKWYASNREKSLDKNLRCKYGLPLADYRAMLAAQGGVCAIASCGSVPTDEKRLQVDHDHACCPGYKSCGKCVRGLICAQCNQALGFASDNVSRLLGMVDYLNSHARVDSR